MSNTNETWIIALGVVVIILTILVIVFAWQAAEDFKEMAKLSKYIEQIENNNTSLMDALSEEMKNADIMRSKLATIEKLRESAKSKYIKFDRRDAEQPSNDNDETDAYILPSVPIPSGMTNTLRCEDFRKFTDTKSDQYQFQLECVTDMETGIRFYRKNGVVYLCGALGGAYCSSIGEAYEVTLKCGTVFNVISADFKHANQMTEPDPSDFGDADKNYDEKPATNVIEFVYDKKIAPKKVIMAGTMTALDQFGGLYGDGGNIVSMVKLGKVWGAK